MEPHSHGCERDDDRYRVLVVDDDEGVRDLLGAALDRSGWELVVVDGGSAALEELERRPADVVLTDIRMPEMDGITLATRVIGEHPGTQVIIMTGFGSIESANRAVRIGAFDYVLKPFEDLSVVRGVVKRAIERVRVERDLVRLEGELARARDSFQSIVERNREALLVVGMDGVVLYANPAAREIFRESHGSLVGRELGLSVVPGESAEITVESGGLRRDLEMSVEITEWMKEPAHLVSMKDLSERKRFIAKMAEMDRFVAMGTLAAGVGHEINNPLSYVIGNIIFAQEGVARLKALRARCTAAQRVREDPEQDATLAEVQGVLSDLDEVLADAAEGASRMRDIVKDLRRLSGGNEEDREDVDLNSAIESAVNTARSEIRRRAQLVWEPTPLPAARGSHAKLGQVFLNLLLNAAHAIEPGRTSRNEITISTSVSGARAVVEISDTGAGIPEEVMPKIFDPFFTTKAVGKGTGLGLSICRRLLESTGGEIEVSSEVGRGSTFRVSVPLGGGAEPEEERLPQGEEPGEAAGRGRLPAVLVVDDDPLVGRMIDRILRESHEVVIAESAKAGLERLAAGDTFDAIVCDLMMPDMTGMDLYGALAEVAPALQPKTVFVTGGAYTERSRHFSELVSNPVVHKPFDADTLRDALATVMGSS